MSSEWIETSVHLLRKRPDGILEARYKDGVRDTLESAREGVLAFRDQLLEPGEGPCPMIIVFGQVVEQTAEAREYYAQSDDCFAVTNRVALLLDSLVSRVLGNLFLGMRKLKVPAKLFNDEDKAIDWLKS